MPEFEKEEAYFYSNRTRNLIAKKIADGVPVDESIMKHYRADLARMRASEVLAQPAEVSPDIPDVLSIGEALGVDESSVDLAKIAYRLGEEQELGFQRLLPEEEIAFSSFRITPKPDGTFPSLEDELIERNRIVRDRNKAIGLVVQPAQSSGEFPGQPKVEPEEEETVTVEAETFRSLDEISEDILYVSKKFKEENRANTEAAYARLKADGVFVDRYLKEDFDKIAIKKKRDELLGERRATLRELVAHMKEGKVSPEEEEIMVKIGIDPDKLNSAGGTPSKKSASTEPPTNIPEKEKRETLDEFIKANEVFLNKLLAREWNSSLNRNPDVGKLVKMVEYSRSIHKLTLLKRYGESDPTVYKDMFIVAQDLYLKEIMTENKFLEIAGNSASIKSQEERVGDATELRARFEGKIIDVVNKIYNGERRRWFEFDKDGILMKNNLEKYLLKRFNSSEIGKDATDVGVVTRCLKTVYLQSDEIRATQEIKISKEPRAELLRQIIKIHDLTVEMDAPSFRSVEAIRPELLQSIDEALISTLKIRKGDIEIVPLVIEAYDYVLRKKYSKDGKEINIDDDSVTQEVRRRLGALFGTAEDDQAKLFIKIGRDICRITGLDAQYGLPKIVWSGVKSGLEPTVKGAFLRSLLNYNKSLITYGSDSRLTGGIELGAVPFWNRLRKTEGVLMPPIFADEISVLVETKMKGNSNFEDWVGKLKGYTEAKKAEGDFIANPTLDNFMTKVVTAYWGYMQYTPGKAKDYFLHRLNSCIPYFVAKGEGRDRLKSSIATIFLKDGIFDGKGVFQDADELKEYFTRGYGIYVDIDSVKTKERRERAIEAGRKGGISGLVDALKNIVS